MGRFRFSISSLLGVVLIISVALAALRGSADVWDGCLLGLTLLILLTAILLAVHRTDRKRAYWLGFSLFGWAYLIATLLPQIAFRLPTTLGFAFIDSTIPGRETTIPPAFAYPSTYSPVSGSGYTPQVYTLPPSMQGTAWIWDLTTGKWVPGPAGTTENFIHIGHSLLALLMAFVGGQLSRYLYGQGREESVLSHRESANSA
jgi:hypothetical protein